MTVFKPCGVVTLTTDFGLEDPFVGVMKGVVLARFPGARLVDVTHAIPPQRPAEAGFWLSRCFEYFPVGSVHVAVVDPGVGTDRAILCAVARGHVLIAPDNGLLAPIVARCEDAEIFALGSATLAALGIQRVSATFHGRDIFAPVAAELAAGRLGPAALGERLVEIAQARAEGHKLRAVGSPAAVTIGEAAGTGSSDTGLRDAGLRDTGLRDAGLRDAGSSGEAAGTLTGRVVTVDHFGNLITDIDSARLASLRDPFLSIAGRRVPLRRTYGDARPGELLALVNSFDVLEIAAAEGSAAATLAVGRGATVLVSPGPLPDGRNPL